MYSLLPVHSIIRWLIVIVGLVAVIKFGIGWLRGGAFTGVDRGLSATFSGLLDLQATLGLILLIGFSFNEGFPAVRFEHAGTVFFALVLAHLPMIWKKAADPVRFRNSFFCFLGALLFIFLGVMWLPIGWSLQPY